LSHICAGKVDHRERSALVGVQGSPTINEEELELEREVEDFVEPEEAFTRDEIE
jgi:hypothetical protein